MGKRAWAFCISFPNTLYQLNKALNDDSYVDLIDKIDDILDHMWSVPKQAQAGDYILHIVTPDNIKRIESLIQELEKHPEEWSAGEYEQLSETLEYAKEDYQQYDGKLLCITPIESILKEDNIHFAQFVMAMSCESNVAYNNAIVKASNERQCMELSYAQTLEIIKTSYTRTPDFEDLFDLNKDVPDAPSLDSEKHVQAFVTNNTFNKSLEELLDDMEVRGFLTIEALFQDGETQWTAPRWCKSGDIAFFMFAKTASATISALTTEYKKTKANFSVREQRKIEEALHRGREIYKKYGGCIFAFARVNGDMIFMNQESGSSNHWRSPIYAPMEQLTILDKPISIDAFRNFLTISRQNTITPVLGDAFDQLKRLIIDSNAVPAFFKELIATPIPLKDINENNWITYGKEYRRRFFLEEAFRRYYVDYLLRELGDKKTIYRECGCYKTSGNPPRVDNIILFQGKYLPVEVKLSIYNEADLPGQARQYCNLSRVEVGSGKSILNPTEEMYTNNVLIIDTENIYLYDDQKGAIDKVFELDRISELKRISDVRKVIEVLLQ